MDLRTLDAMNPHPPFTWVLRIPAAGDAGHLDISPDLPNLAALLDAEILTVIRLPCASDVWVDLVLDTNASGLDRGRNWRATELARALGWEGDGLLGSAVFVGCDANGDPCDVPQHLAVLYFQLTGDRVEGRMNERR